MKISSAAASGLPAIAWHSVTAADPGYAYVHGGQRYDGLGSYFQEVRKINLSIGAASTVAYWPFGHAHSCCVNLSGRHTVSVGMGESGTAFRALEEVQWFDLPDSTQHWTGNPGPFTPFGGYDMDAVRLTDSRMMAAGGHVVVNGQTRARNDAMLIEKAASGMTYTPLMLSVPRSYLTSHRLSDTTGIFIGGIEYTDLSNNTRNTGAIEELSADGSNLIWSQQIRPRRYHSSRMIGSKIYVMGGTDSPIGPGRPPACAKVDVLDTVSRTVTPMPDLMRARCHGHSAAVNIGGDDYLLFWGGQSDNLIPVLDVEMYRVADGTSQIVGQTPPTLDHDRITITDGANIWTIGGENAVSGQGTNSIVKLATAGTVTRV